MYYEYFFPPHQFPESKHNKEIKGCEKNSFGLILITKLNVIKL